MQLLNHIPINIGYKFVNLSLLRCPEDVLKPAGFSSGGFGASPRHIIMRGLEKENVNKIA